nr:MAG TPA: minor structural protein [Caudoviricetes sp.]
MALEWLKTILGNGYTEDIESKIAQEIGKGFVAKADFNAIKTQQKKLEDDLKNRDTQLEELKKATGTAEELTAQIAALQEQNRKDKQAHEAEVARIRLDAAVDKALTDSGARNNIAVKALLAAFLKDAKVGEGGSVKGLAAEIETLAKGENTSFLFDNTKGAIIKGMKPGEAGDGAGYGGEVNPFAAKTFDLEAQGKLFREKPDVARALAKQAGVKFV